MVLRINDVTERKNLCNLQKGIFLETLLQYLESNVRYFYTSEARKKHKV